MGKDKVERSIDYQKRAWDYADIGDYQSGIRNCNEAIHLAPT